MFGRHGCGRWESRDDVGHERREDQRTETGPDGTARPGESVDLRHYVVEQVTDRKEKDARAVDVFTVEGKFDRRDFVYTDEVRTEENGNERRHDEIEILVASRPRHRADCSMGVGFRKRRPK